MLFVTLLQLRTERNRCVVTVWQQNLYLSPNLVFAGTIFLEFISSKQGHGYFLSVVGSYLNFASACVLFSLYLFCFFNQLMMLELNK